MSKRQCSEEQRQAAVRKIEMGATLKDIAQEYGVTMASLHSWRGKYGTNGHNPARDLNLLKDENFRLRQIVSRLVLENDLLKSK